MRNTINNNVTEPTAPKTILHKYHEKLSATVSKWAFVKACRSSVLSFIAFLIFCLGLYFIGMQYFYSLRSESDFDNLQSFCGELVSAKLRGKSRKSSLDDVTFVRLSKAGKEEKFRINGYDGNIVGSGFKVNTKQLVDDWSSLHKARQVCVMYIPRPLLGNFPVSVCTTDQKPQCLIEESTRKMKYLNKVNLTIIKQGAVMVFIPGLFLLFLTLKERKKALTLKKENSVSAQL